MPWHEWILIIVLAGLGVWIGFRWLLAQMLEGLD